MAIKGYFFNAVKDTTTGEYDRTYNSEDITSYLDLLVGGGVFPNPSTNLQVMQNSGMDITVKAGSGWINGHKMINTADLVLTVASSDVLLDRIDRVVFYLDSINREMGIEILEGTPASSPVAPSLTQTAARYEYSLATISIAHELSEITQSVITDTRADSSVCGWVSGLIQQVDTSTLFNQWQTAYQEFYDSSTSDFETWSASMRTQFDAWFATLSSQLQVNTYIEQYHKYVELAYTDSKIVPLDMTDYTYESTDIFFISINGLTATETEDYSIDTSTTPPEVHLNFVGSTNQTEEVDIKVLKSKIGYSTAQS